MDNQAQILDLARLQRLAETAMASGCELREILGDPCAMYTAEGSLIEFFEAATPAVVLKLIAEAQALQQDSARYRWLRDKSESGHSFYLSVPLWLSGIRFRKEDVDAGIDTAMGGGEPS